MTPSSPPLSPIHPDPYAPEAPGRPGLKPKWTSSAKDAVTGALGGGRVRAAVGYGVARQSDEHLWSEQRASLRNAISDFRALFGQSDPFDPRFVRMVGRSSGPQHRKFEPRQEQSHR